MWELKTINQNFYQFEIGREKAITEILNDSWEPFAVDNGIIYFRRFKKE